MNINRVTLQHNKEFSYVFFLFSGFITMSKLKKHLIREAFWVLLKTMFINDWEQTEQRLKLQESWDYQQPIRRNIIRWNIYRSLQRQQFSFTKTSINKVPKNPESLSLKLKVYNSSRLPGVCFFQRWIRGKKIAQSFLSTAKFMTKYSLERFLSIYCRSGGGCTVTW